VPAQPTLSIAVPSPQVTSTATITAASATPIPFENLTRLYEYDQKAPLDIQEKSVEDKEGIQVRDISYASPKSGRVVAYLVTPSGKGPFAGIVWMHWLGSTNSNRNEFLDDAIASAKKGAVSILIDGNFPWLKPPSNLDADRTLLTQQVIDIRRGLDLLLARTDVDPKRIAYVGHDFGAMYGSILAGMDRRSKTYVLVAGTTTFHDWFLTYWNPASADKREEYRTSIAAFDPIRYVDHAAPAALFFQFSTIDRFVPNATAEEFYNAASNPKSVKWYSVPHQMKSDDVTTDRLDWLNKQLGLN
jgi:cephalosporin-C deacetylase-like acetyl esterase